MNTSQGLNNPVSNTMHAWAKRNGMEGKVHAAIASELGVSRTTVYSWERSGYVSNRSLAAFAALVGCSPYEVSFMAHLARSANQ